MGELFFTVKTFILTGAIILCLQIEIGESTLEEKAEDWVRTSPVTKSLNKVARGAAQAVREGVHGAVEIVQRTIGASPAIPIEKASRLNFDLKRAPSAIIAPTQQYSSEKNPQAP